MTHENKRKSTVEGLLKFRVPYNGVAEFAWRLDPAGRDVIVECQSPWKGIRTDVHQNGMGPRFKPAEARRLAETLCRKIIENLESVINHLNDEKFELVSYYDNRQLPLYREFAWQEQKRRCVEVGLLAEAHRDDDESDDSSDGTLSADYTERAEAELKAQPVELINVQ